VNPQKLKAMPSDSTLAKSKREDKQASKPDSAPTTAGSQNSDPQPAPPQQKK
jgi:hypothetical protein